MIRPDKGDKSTKQWVASLISKIRKDKGERYEMSAGISSYPFRDYSKTEIVRNCQKALLHGSFFGPGSTVIFDSLSLNVSGDAYFSESDLSGAVREYRKGLDIDENDVNLLNSLGVTYALMNRTADAVSVFHKVIENDPRNFMALFNKGLGEKALKNYSAAVDSFTSALGSFNHKDIEETAVANDLRFQLGTCLYHLRNYKECINVLKKWHRSAKDKAGSEKCFKYIGISYFYLDNMKQAAQWLQRGLAANQSDAESLSLLGSIYLNSNEGDDIALKLCEKSVEIEPHNQSLKIRYGRALSACLRLDEALEIFIFCTRFKSLRKEAWLERKGPRH